MISKAKQDEVTAEARTYESMTFEVQVKYDPHRQLGGVPHYEFKVRNASTGVTITEGGWCTSRKDAMGAGWDYLDRVMGTAEHRTEKQKWRKAK